MVNLIIFPGRKNNNWVTGQVSMPVGPSTRCFDWSDIDVFGLCFESSDCVRLVSLFLWRLWHTNGSLSFRNDRNTVLTVLKILIEFCIRISFESLRVYRNQCFASSRRFNVLTAQLKNLSIVGFHCHKTKSKLCLQVLPYLGLSKFWKLFATMKWGSKGISKPLYYCFVSLQRCDSSN